MGSRAQVKRIVVIEIDGKAEFVSNGHKRPLYKGAVLNDESLLYIPYKGKVVVIDENNNKEFTIRAIGWASIDDKLKDGRNTVLNRTKDYVKSVVAQFNGNQSAKAQYVSDPATITREYYVDDHLTDDKEPQKAQGRNFRADFDAFKKKARQEYDDFRKKALKEYAEFVRQAWLQIGAEPPVEPPVEEEVEPVLSPDADGDTASWFSRLFRRKKSKKTENKPKTTEPKSSPSALPYKSVVQPVPFDEQPQPLSVVNEVPDEANGYKSFKVYGTDIRVRLGDDCRFTLPSVANSDVANAIQLFTKSQFDNLLYDCLQMRDKYQLSDWAYYQMLLTLTNLFYGTSTNEGTLVLAFLYAQSGYKMRLASNGHELVMLLASKHIIYKKKFYYVDGDNFYLLDGRDTDNLSICPAKFPKESSLSLQIRTPQMFAVDPTPERTVTSRMNEDFSFTISSNKNYMDFYDTYPSSCFYENFMTRWAMYGNTPVEQGIQQQLYPPMRKKLQGLSPQEAVQQLLYWVQTGFEYAYDEEVWGVDRPFFAEESLFYPYCDCEDRSILLSHLVRDLLGLKTILIYYPGHLAMGVSFNTEVEGDYIMLDGRKFIVCDPTYIPSRVGHTMPQMNNEEATVILLD